MVDVLEPGVKDEPFSVSLAVSQEAVDAVDVWLQERGYIVAPLRRRDPKRFPDDGDLLTFRYNDRGQKYWFRTVDVKRSSAWTGKQHKYSTPYITTEKELHLDWIYIVTSSDLSRALVFDMMNIHTSVLRVDDTLNRRNEPQRSVAVPRHLGKLYKL